MSSNSLTSFHSANHRIDFSALNWWVYPHFTTGETEANKKGRILPTVILWLRGRNVVPAGHTWFSLLLELCVWGTGWRYRWLKRTQWSLRPLTMVSSFNFWSAASKTDMKRVHPGWTVIWWGFSGTDRRSEPQQGIRSLTLRFGKHLSNVVFITSFFFLSSLPPCSPPTRSEQEELL